MDLAPVCLVSILDSLLISRAAAAAEFLNVTLFLMMRRAWHSRTAAC